MIYLFYLFINFFIFYFCLFVEMLNLKHLRALCFILLLFFWNAKFKTFESTLQRKVTLQSYVSLQSTLKIFKFGISKKNFVLTFKVFC